MIRVDLHLHTIYSSDASIQPKTIVDQLQAHPFIKAVAITDHNTVEGYHKVQKLARPFQDIHIIPGFELTVAEGDLLVLGVPELPPKPWTIKNTIIFAKERNGLVAVPHPYRAYGIGDLARKYDFDAIETMNGTSTIQANRKAQSLAKAVMLPGIGGSDAHRADELWSVYTEVQASADSSEILESVKKRLVKVSSARKLIYY